MQQEALADRLPAEEAAAAEKAQMKLVKVAEAEDKWELPLTEVLEL
jgi:hypothetical protein